MRTPLTYGQIRCAKKLCESRIVFFTLEFSKEYGDFPNLEPLKNTHLDNDSYKSLLHFIKQYNILLQNKNPCFEDFDKRFVELLKDKSRPWFIKFRDAFNFYAKQHSGKDAPGTWGGNIGE